MNVCWGFCIQISKNRRVSVRNWNGKIWIDIREFYVKDGKTLPGKKGKTLFAFFLSCLRSPSLLLSFHRCKHVFPHVLL